ncbi:phosphate transporter [Polyporus arcularius HHB13444]|uniref:Phosphate transporter n=1 Tax=Polyporus arcularius HHB13444 TaxID=1314778 RepID=A0A5C3PRS1_9APHY|nr:phosphate transporter [Polyporus arcularius HHB13444]
MTGTVSYAADEGCGSSADVPLSTLGREDSIVLNSRRRAALAEIDQADFSWFHVKVCMVAGVGFFTDAYDIFGIGIAATMLGYCYGPNGVLTNAQDLGIKVATPVGTLIGQLLFGWLGDVFGRKRMYGIELMIIIIATFGQALAGSGLRAVNIIGVLVVWRFIMGVGIGGDYPLSAVISSEFSSTRIRGRMMTAVFANQGWGQLTASIIALIVVTAYKKQVLHSVAPGGATGPGIVTDTEWVDYMWRLLIGFGCVPGAVALYFRLTIPETPRFTMDVERNVHQAAQDVEDFLTMGTYYVDPDAVVQRVQAPRASRYDFGAYFARRENWLLLVGTAYSWFALDIAFYGLGLNTPIVLEAIHFGGATLGDLSPQAVYGTLRNLAVGNIILSVAGLVPGYWATFLLIDRWGRKPIQLMGFIVLAVLFIVMGSAFDKLRETEPGTKAFVFLYCLANFFMNFGPNTTTFIVPGEAFPTRYRSTAHGISAASGKLGAIIAQVGFANLKDIGGGPNSNHFLGHLLQILAFFMLTGVGSTLLIKETKQKTLEDLSNERQDSFVGGVSGAIRP